jgi:hypothetical protein
MTIAPPATWAPVHGWPARIVKTAVNTVIRLRNTPARPGGTAVKAWFHSRYDRTDGNTAMNSSDPSAAPVAGSAGPPDAMPNGASTTTATADCTAVEVTGGRRGPRRPATVYAVHDAIAPTMSSSPTPKPPLKSEPGSPSLRTTRTPASAMSTPPTDSGVSRSCRNTAAASVISAGLNALTSEALNASVCSSAAYRNRL